MRLEKLLADANIGTRTFCKQEIKKGKISVNGSIIKECGFQADYSDKILYQNKEILLKSNYYYMFHKPANCVCANHDKLHKTVIDYFPLELHKNLVIIGRLDLDTEGLLLLTTDGDFCHKLTAPSKHLPKTYYFHAEGNMVEDAISKALSGLDIGEEKLTKPAILKYHQDGNLIEGTLVITEGKFHQVKRMIHVLGGAITYLKRISIGNLKLDDNLLPGDYRELHEEDINNIFKEGNL